MANLLDDCQTVDQTEFYGANLIVDEEDANQPQGLYNRNVMFSEGLFQTRNGFGPAFMPPDLVKSMYNWRQQTYNRILLLTPSALVSHDLTGANPDQTVLTGIAASGMTNIQSGTAVYTALFDATGEAVTNVKVWNGRYTSGNADINDAFQATFDVSVLQGGENWGIFSEPNPGSVTAGFHLFGLVVTDQTGFQMPPGPTSIGVFSSVSFTCSGGRTLKVVVTPATTWPLYVSTIQLCMTAQGNQSRWYLVPSTVGGGPVPVGGAPSSIPVTFEIDIDDGSLVLGTEITDTLFNLYTGPLACHCITSYGNRAVYIFRAEGPDRTTIVANLFFSDPYKPQYVIPLYNQLYLPEFRDCITGCELGGSFFAYGPGWTYAWSDNMQVPTSWSPPRLISGYIGSPFIRGVCPSPDKGFAWVADKSGLFCFTGQNYTVIPASYLQTPDWERINFNADANALVIKEVPSLRMVFVKAPIDGSNHANAMLVWDFTNGVTPGKIKYCGLFNFTSLLSIGDIETVTSPTTKVRELYLSPGQADDPSEVLRMKSIAGGDATEANLQPLYDDNGAGIDSLYKVLTVIAAQRGKAQQVGIRVRHRGMGETKIWAYGFDNDFPVPMVSISAQEASMNPGHRYTRYVDLQSETAAYEFFNEAVPGAFFIIAAIRSYFLPWMDE